MRQILGARSHVMINLLSTFMQLVTMTGNTIYCYDLKSVTRTNYELPEVIRGIQ
jgi:hypothetical protein